MSSTSSPSRSPIDSSFLDRKAEQQIDVDRVLRALAHRRRREILGLLDETPSATRADLLERLIDLQDGPASISREEMAATLLHTHLPKLQQSGLVDLDEECWLIEQGESFGFVRDMADAAASANTEY